MAAILFSQLEQVERFNAERRAIWLRYHAAFAGLETAGIARRPIVPPHCEHNAHLYYLLLRDRSERDRLIEGLRSEDIWAPFHYVPLHSSPAGLRYARANGELGVTDMANARLVRLPMYAGMEPSVADRVIERIHAYLRG